MSASSINDLQHWRDSAEEIRALVDDIKDEASKQKMLRIADDYERLGRPIRVVISGLVSDSEYKL